jgi:integrase
MTRRRLRTVELCDDLAALKREMTAFLVECSLAETTRVEYGRMWRSYGRWCEERNVLRTPPDPAVIRSFLAWLGSRLVDDDGEIVRESLADSTVGSHLAAIRYHLALEGFRTEALRHIDVTETLAGIGRVLASPPVKKRPLRPDDVRVLLTPPAPTLMDLQKRVALLLARETGLGWARLVRIRRDRHVDVVGGGYVITVPAVLGTKPAPPDTWRVRDPEVADAARLKAGFTSWTGVARKQQPGEPKSLGGVAGAVSIASPSFVHAVGTGVKSCKRPVAEAMAGALGMRLGQLFVLNEDTTEYVMVAEVAVTVPHRHQELQDGLGLLFTELACPACAIGDLLQAGGSAHPWLLGWTQDRAGAAVSVDVDGNDEVRRLARSLETRWAFTAMRLGLPRAVAGEVSALSSLDLWRLLVCADNEFLVYLRDRAYVLTGWHGAFRRAELWGMTHEHLDEVRARDTGKLRGLVVDLPRSKSDPEGEGAHVGLVAARDPLLCAVRALLTYLAATGLRQGPVFIELSGKKGAFGSGPGRLGAGSVEGQADGVGRGMVDAMLARLCARAGLTRVEWGSHSMRNGYVVTALEDGATGPQIMAKTRHASPDQIANYARSDGRRGRGVARRVLA